MIPLNVRKGAPVEHGPLIRSEKVVYRERFRPRKSDKERAMSNVQYDEAAMMEAWTKAATPGERHKIMDALVGEFDADATFYMGPDAMQSKGVAKSEWILGGRFVHMRYSGDACGQAFEGVGYFGFDNVRQMYVGTWMDSMTTMIMYHEGAPGSDQNVIEMRGEFINAMGQKIKDRHVTTIVDHDHHQFDMHHTGEDGQEHLVGTIKYTRRK